MQIPILSGIVADAASEFRTKYPRNYVPVPKDQGISKGYLRPGEGIVQFGTGPGVDRGGVNWRGVCYRVMGTKLVSIAADGNTLTIGDVGDGGQCTLDYDADRLAVASGGRLYYWNGTTLTQVTDPDLGQVVDFMAIDGYFMTTDGTFLVVTELNDPAAVDPLKYGSAELDPDEIKRVLKLRNEASAVGRYTIENYTNVGGTGFPFQRNTGAQLHRGALGTYCACIFPGNDVRPDGIAFLGSGRNESPAVWLGAQGTTAKLSTAEIDKVLKGYSEAQLSLAIVESRVDEGHAWLYVHLPAETWVYDANASAVLQEPVWFSLDSGSLAPSTYRARNFVWCYDKWLCGDPTSTSHGYLSGTTSAHLGTTVGWEFGTLIVYNEGRGAIFHGLELVGLPGTPTPAVAAVPPGYAFYSRNFDDGLLYDLSTRNAITTIVSGTLRLATAALAVGNVRFDAVPNHTDGDATYNTFVPTVGDAAGDVDFHFLTTYWGTPGTQSMGYGIQLMNTQFRLIKGSNTDAAPFASVPVSVSHGLSGGAAVTIRVRYETVTAGKRIRAWLNGALLIDFTDPFPWVSGQVAFRGFASTDQTWIFDNFSITYNTPGVIGVDTLDPVVWTSYSLDGRAWSREVPTRAGKLGQTEQRIAWRRQGKMNHWRMQKFRGTSDCRVPFARLEAQIEGLA